MQLFILLIDEQTWETNVGNRVHQLGVYNYACSVVSDLSIQMYILFNNLKITWW